MQHLIARGLNRVATRIAGEQPGADACQTMQHQQQAGELSQTRAREQADHRAAKRQKQHAQQLVIDDGRQLMRWRL